MADKANPLSPLDFNPVTGTVGQRRTAAPARADRTRRASQGSRGSGPGRVAAQPRARRDAPEGQVRELRPELQPGRAGVEPRRQPAGREGAEGALRRHRALRQPALAADRQAEHRLGQDGAVPHHRPVQSPGSRHRLAAEPGGVSDRPLGAAGGLVLLQRRASRGRSPRGGDELRRVRADRHRSLRRALRAASGLRQDLRSDGARVRGGRDRGGGEACESLGQLSRGSRWAAVWSGVTTVSASPSPTSTATTTGPTSDPIFSYTRNVDPLSGRPRWGMEDGALPDRQGGELPDREECADPPQREPDAVPLHLRHQRRLHRPRFERLRPEHLHQPEPGGSRPTPSRPPSPWRSPPVIRVRIPTQLPRSPAEGSFSPWPPTARPLRPRCAP